MSNGDDKTAVTCDKRIELTMQNENPSSSTSETVISLKSGRKRSIRVLIFLLSILLSIAIITVTTLFKLNKQTDIIIPAEFGLDVTITTIIMTILPTTIPTNNGMNQSTTSISITTIHLITTTLAPTCNVEACRRIIDYYISRKWAYDTINFGECPGCLEATYPNFPSNWVNYWYRYNIYIPTSAGQDCLGNPYTGTLTVCQSLCLRDTTCVAFSREKNVSDLDSTAQCWLKNNTQLYEIVNDVTWSTLIFNSTSE